MGSIAMDSGGNIALGYSVSSINTDPSIRYVTRESGDPPGTLPGGEVEVIAGGGAQLGSHRWGDYSTLSVDPVADCTFWYTQEYYASSGYFDFKTRIAAFKMPNCDGQPPPPPPPPLEGDVIVSFSVEAGLLNSTLGGEVVRPADAVDLETGELVFSAFPDTILEDIDAFHVMPEGEVVFSTSTDVTQGFGGIPYIRNGDLVLWDGEEATLLFSELIGFGSPYHNIDAFSILPSGSWLLSTDLDAILGGLAFENGDIVEYDPEADVATLYMGLDEATIFTGTPNSNPDIDALHATADGKVILSIRSDGIGRVGNGPTYGFLDAPRTDLFEIDPETLDASLFLDGYGIFDGMTRNLDAVALPQGADLYYPEGPQVDVPVTDLVGWELCDSRLYSSSTGLALNSILNACDKANLLLACRQTGNSTLRLLAVAPRSDVLFDTGTGDTPHVANSSGWYFNDDYSWGFAREGDPIIRNSCDVASSNASERLCWHTHRNSVGGWRCGTTTSLNSSNAWEKLIYHAD
jgi:hypothetical protein